MLAAVLPAAGLSVALADNTSGKARFRLGGAWIGTDGAGFIFNHLQIALDPAGKTAALRSGPVTINQANADLLNGLGADTASDFVSQASMISDDTAKTTLIGYALASGNPPQMKAIFVFPGTYTFTGPDTMEANYSLLIFPPSADGLPHGDPLMTFPGLTATLTRVG